MGSGCGSVGRVVAFDTRGLRFKSSHRQNFNCILIICLLSTVYRKDENKEKEAGNGPFFKKNKQIKQEVGNTSSKEEGECSLVDENAVVWSVLMYHKRIYSF